MQDDFSQAFKGLVNSKLGEELIKEYMKLHASLIDDAEKAETQETAFGLLKEARGVIKTIEHLQFLAVAPKDESGKG